MDFLLNMSWRQLLEEYKLDYVYELKCGGSISSTLLEEKWGRPPPAFLNLAPRLGRLMCFCFHMSGRKWDQSNTKPKIKTPGYDHLNNTAAYNKKKPNLSQRKSKGSEATLDRTIFILTC